MQGRTIHEMPSIEPSGRFKKYSVFLWPAGGTLLGLLVMPLAIEDYPEFFHENTWLLPLSVLCVVTCFCIPLLFHERVIRGVTYVSRLPHEVLSLVLAGVLPVVVGLGFLYGGVELFRFHRNHLLTALNKQSTNATQQCSVSIEVTSEIIARIHERAMWRSSGQTDEYKPIFQDLFHDWVIKLTPNGTAASQVIVTIQDSQKPVDHIRVLPAESAVISEPKAGWLSGFDEPSQTPDFYLRTIGFTALTKPTVIRIRRPIKSQAIGVNTITIFDLNLDRFVRAVAENCTLVQGTTTDRDHCCAS